MQKNEVSYALKAIKKAWTETCIDYGDRRLNSERALQSSFYHHLRPLLEKRSPDYSIFIEAAIILPAVEADESTETVASALKRIVIDTLICIQRQILVAIELKYTPRYFPDELGLRKDLTSLSEIRNHTAKKRRVKVELPRHRSSEAGDPLVLEISSDAKLVLGVYCADTDSRMDERDFWKAFRPKNGPWKSRVRELPPKLGLCIAYALAPSLEKPAEAVFFGRPFLQSKR